MTEVAVPPPDRDVGILCNDERVCERLAQLCASFEYTCEIWKDPDVFLDTPRRPRILIAYLDSPEGPLAAAELAQLVRFNIRDAFLICLSQTVLTKEAAAFSRKSGADLIMLREEIMETSKLEFVATQIIRNKYLPIKPADLRADVPISFDLFHLLPQRRKFLTTAFAGDVLDEKKLEKIRQAGEIYIARDEAVAFAKYIAETSPGGREGMERRCRSKFLALFAEFSGLCFKLSNQAEHASFGDGQALLAKCDALCSELIGALAESGQPWRVINNSAIGDFGSLERAPAVAAYAGLLALQMGWQTVDEVMRASLLADLGLLFLPPGITHSLRSDEIGLITPQAKAQFEKYPQRSVEILLDRKLSIAGAHRQWIVQSLPSPGGAAARAKKGDDKPPAMEGRLITFCRDFDRMTLLKLGKPRVSAPAAFRELAQKTEAVDRYGGDLMMALLAVAPKEEGPV